MSVPLLVDRDGLAYAVVAVTIAEHEALAREKGEPMGAPIVVVVAVKRALLDYLLCLPYLHNRPALSPSSRAVWRNVMNLS